MHKHEIQRERDLGKILQLSLCICVRRKNKKNLLMYVAKGLQSTQHHHTCGIKFKLSALHAIKQAGKQTKVFFSVHENVIGNWELYLRGGDQTLLCKQSKTKSSSLYRQI